MTIFFENLFNIITERKETVYTFGEICNKFGVPAKKKNGVLFRGFILPSQA